jgi:hypothetical protein
MYEEKEKKKKCGKSGKVEEGVCLSPQLASRHASACYWLAEQRGAVK